MQAVSASVAVMLTLSLGNASVLAQISAGWLSSIHMFDARNGWAVDAEGWGGVGAKGAVSSVVRTTDGGLHWRDVTPHAPVGQQIDRYGFDVGWLSPLSAWMSTVVGTQIRTPGVNTRPMLFTTVNGGATWKSMPLPLSGNIVFLNARDGWLIAWNDDVYRSSNGGETWSKIGRSKHLHQLIGITFLNTRIGWIAGFSDTRDGVYPLVTHDGGHTWEQQKLPAPSQVTSPWYLNIGSSPDFFDSHDGVLLAVYGGNADAGVLFYVSHDAGTTWVPTTPVRLQSYLTASGGLMPIYRSSSFTDAKHGWVTDGDALNVTSDGGHQWTTIRPSSPFAFVGELDFISPHVGWATGQPLNMPFLLKTVDGGHTWTSLPYAISP